VKLRPRGPKNVRGKCADWRPRGGEGYTEVYALGVASEDRGNGSKKGQKRPRLSSSECPVAKNLMFQLTQKVLCERTGAGHKIDAGRRGQ